MEVGSHDESESLASFPTRECAHAALEALQRKRRHGCSPNYWFSFAPDVFAMGSHARQVVALWAQSAVLLFHLVQQTVGERSTPQLFSFSTTDREPPDWDQLLPLGQLHAPY